MVFFIAPELLIINFSRNFKKVRTLYSTIFPIAPRMNDLLERNLCSQALAVKEGHSAKMCEIGSVRAKYFNKDQLHGGNQNCGQEQLALVLPYSLDIPLYSSYPLYILLNILAMINDTMWIETQVYSPILCQTSVQVGSKYCSSFQVEPKSLDHTFEQPNGPLSHDFEDLSTLKYD